MLGYDGLVAVDELVGDDAEAPDGGLGVFQLRGLPFGDLVFGAAGPVLLKEVFVSVVAELDFAVVEQYRFQIEVDARLLRLNNVLHAGKNLIYDHFHFFLSQPLVLFQVLRKILALTEIPYCTVSL